MNSVFKTKTYLEVWDSDLNKFVSGYYGRPWDFASVEESNNDTYHTMTVDEEEPERFIGSGPAENLQRWMDAEVPAKGDWQASSAFEACYPPAPVIMWDLCRRGVIPAGEYLIHVSW